jgi:hydrogenase-4 membrane subunit HyfE
MKANVLHIVAAHFRTLQDHPAGKTSIQDVAVFYLVPAAIAILACYSQVTVGKDVYSLAVSVFAIFAALLLSVQIALFGIFQRGWAPPPDPKLEKHQADAMEARRDLLKELNTNISYLTVVCCAFIVLLVLFYVLAIPDALELGIFCFVFSHFALTLFMVIKRAHALFQREYDVA